MRPAQWTTTHGDVVTVYREQATCLREDCTTNHRVFRYRVQAANGENVEQGSESYTRRSAAVDAALRHHPRLDTGPDPVQPTLETRPTWNVADQ